MSRGCIEQQNNAISINANDTYVKLIISGGVYPAVQSNTNNGI